MPTRTRWAFVVVVCLPLTGCVEPPADGPQGDSLEANVKRLGNPVKETREAAATALSTDPEAALPLVDELLATSTSPIAKAEAARLLKDWAERGMAPEVRTESTETLVAALDDNDRDVRAAVADALAAAKPEPGPTLQPLLARLEAENVDSVRIAVVEALGVLGPDAAAALPKLRSLHDELPPHRREKVTEAISRIESKVLSSDAKPADEKPAK